MESFEPEGAGFHRMTRLPPYIFGIVNQLKMEARQRGEDIIDLGMGNPDLPTPKHIVNKLIEAVKNPRNHRYSASKGIYKLRMAITDSYRRRYDVELDPETESVVTIGAKEGLGHLVLATIGPGDVVLVPDPTYPIHAYSVVIAGGDLRSVPFMGEGEFFQRVLTASSQDADRQLSSQSNDKGGGSQFLRGSGGFCEGSSSDDRPRPGLWGYCV